MDIFTFYKTYAPKTLDSLIINKKPSIRLYNYLLNINKTRFKCFILYSDFQGCGKRLAVNIISSMLHYTIIYDTSLSDNDIIELLLKKKDISSFFTPYSVILELYTLTPFLIQFLTTYSKTFHIPVVIILLSSVFLKKYKLFAHCIFFKKPIKKHLFSITEQLIQPSLSLFFLNTVQIKKIISRISLLSIYNIDTLFSLCYKFNMFCTHSTLIKTPFLFFHLNIQDPFLLHNTIIKKKNKKKILTKKNLFSLYTKQQQHVFLSNHSEYYKNRCFDHFITSPTVDIQQCYELNEHLSFIDTYHNNTMKNNDSFSSFYYYYINEYCILQPIKKSTILLNIIL